MPNIQISQLPAAGPLDGTELVPIVQSGLTVQTTTQAISSSPNQTQTFLTVNQEPSLPNSRSLSANNGVTLVDGGAQASLTVQLTGAASQFQNAAAGIMAKTSTATVASRTITASGSGLQVTNGNGVSGDPTIALTGRIAALAGIGGSSGLVALSGSSVTSVTIQGTAGEIDVANGAGPGNPTIGIADNAVLPGTGGVVVPKGTSAQQPAGTSGQLRFNTDTQTFDGYSAGSWRQFSTAGGVTSFSAGSTGLTPSSPTTGVVTLGGTLNVGNGGTGATNLSGYLVGNGTSPFTAVATIPNAGLTNSSITINGSTVALGGSVTVTATASNALTIGTGLSGTSYNGSAPVTIAIDSSVVTLNDSQTLTNKSMSGSSNTFTNIPNNALTNSSVTYNGVNVALGGSGTITAANPNALTIGTGLTGTSYDGSTPVTIAIDSTVATLTGVQTLTNKSMSGASNTFTNIPNNALSNYTISGVALGGNLFPLTIGTGLSGGSYDGSGNITVAIDSTVATLTGIQTLTNKSISGATNTLSSIPNSALTNSTITLGSTSTALGATSLTLAGLTSVTVTQDPLTALQLATKQYVDTLVASGITYHTPVKYEVPDTTGNLNAIYNQPGGPGVGVGATLTNNGTLAAFAPDGPTASPGDRILVYNQTNQFENGVYTVTTVGNGSTAWVLTRATDADTYALKSPTGLGEGDAFFITSGNTGAGETYVCNTSGVITFGTTAITFAQVSSAPVYSAGTGLTLTGTQFSITNTGVSASTYGSASSVPTIAVNAQGQITSASNTAIAINGNQITSGTVGSAYITGSYTGITGVGTLTAGTWNATAVDPAYGGTGLTSYAVGNIIYATGTTTLAKLAIGTSGQYLSSSGAAPQWSSPAALTKTDDTNVTLTLGGNASTALLNSASIAVGWTGELSTTRGGTGLSSYAAGDLVYYATGTTLSKLAIGTSNQILTSSGTAPQWTSGSSISVGTATNLAGGALGSVPYQSGAGATAFLAGNTTTTPQFYTSTGTGSAAQAPTLTSSTGSGSVVLATSPTLVTPNLGTPSALVGTNITGTASGLSIGGNAATATTATNSSNSAIAVDSTNANYFINIVSTNTGNLPIKVATGLTANPSTGKITGGIAGGTF